MPGGELYPSIIEWRGASNDGRVTAVHPAAMECITVFGEKVKGDVVNAIPPQMAGRIARDAGLAAQSGGCPIKPATFESAQAPDVYMLGNATIAVALTSTISHQSRDLSL